MDIPWICGGDDQLSVGESLGKGRYSEVYEMFLKGDNALFARKIIRTGLDEAFEREIRILHLIRDLQRHRNLIFIFDDGRLPAFGDYFIDMEIADFSLASFIEYYRSEEHSEIDSKYTRPCDTEFSLEGCSSLEKMRKFWTIGRHMSQGLHFLHRNNVAHRSLRPTNVLYCRYDKVWKLTDYSLNRRSPAFDNWAGPLEDYGYDDPFRRGNFPPNMDIWSLGCVIYELVTLRKAFPNYSAFADVGSSLSALRTSAAASSNFLQDHMADSIFDLIQVDPNKRPPISLVDRIFGSYCEMLEIPGARILCDAPCYPRYQDWKAAIEIQLDSEGGKIFDKSMLYRLGDLLVENDQYHEACLVYKMTEQCR